RCAFGSVRVGDAIFPSRITRGSSCREGFSTNPGGPRLVTRIPPGKGPIDPGRGRQWGQVPGGSEHASVRHRGVLTSAWNLSATMLGPPCSSPAGTATLIEDVT